MESQNLYTFGGPLPAPPPSLRRRLSLSERIGEGGVVGVVVGVLIADLLLGDVHSLKGKRGVVRPVVAELRRRFDVAAAETGGQDLYRRTEVSVAVVSSEHAHARHVLEECERFVAGRPEMELLSTRIRVLDDEDLA